MRTFVYVISGDHGRQKIGISDNPRKRIRELQTGSPYQLRFEFVGETEDRSAGAVEVEAHFMLAQHKSPGGDEWFTVPPDVAVTAVMAAAHRLGYRIKPVDADAVAPKTYAIGGTRPMWVRIAMLPFLAWFVYWILVIQDARMQNGELLLGTLAIEGVAVLLVLWILSWIIQIVGNRLIALWQAWNRLMHPEDGAKVPLE